MENDIKNNTVLLNKIKNMENEIKILRESVVIDDKKIFLTKMKTIYNLKDVKKTDNIDIKDINLEEFKICYQNNVPYSLNINDIACIYNTLSRYYPNKKFIFNKFTGETIVAIYMTVFRNEIGLDVNISLRVIEEIIDKIGNKDMWKTFNCYNDARNTVIMLINDLMESVICKIYKKIYNYFKN